MKKFRKWNIRSDSHIFDREAAVSDREQRDFRSQNAKGKNGNAILFSEFSIWNPICRKVLIGF